MFKVTELPKPPFKSFKEFRLHTVEKSSKHHKTGKKAQYPCTRCDGYGKHYRDEDRDPYEGWKMASMHHCERCNGTGDVGFRGLADEYDRVMNRHREHYARLKPIHDREAAALAKARECLTTAELRTLGLIPERKPNARRT